MKDFVNTLASTTPSLKLTEAQWMKVTEICDTFEDCYYFTKRSQSEQMTLSDFYAEWKEMEFKLKKKPKCELIDNLIQYMGHRETQFLQSPVVLAALFLDVRYRVLLKEKPMATQTAINHLARLWKRIRELQPTQSPDDNQEVSSDIENDAIDESNFEHYLDTLESTTESVPLTTATDYDEIILKLTQFDNKMKSKKREPKKNHPMDFWMANKTANIELFQLAEIVFAVASTEVSVERNFSGLAFILNKLRCCLTDEILDTILFVRLNKSLFYKILDPFMS